MPMKRFGSGVEERVFEVTLEAGFSFEEAYRLEACMDGTNWGIKVQGLRPQC